jgi:hypothetical protein
VVSVRLAVAVGVCYRLAVVDGVCYRLAVVGGVCYRLAVVVGVCYRLAVVAGVCYRLAVVDGVRLELAVVDGVCYRLAVGVGVLNWASTHLPGSNTHVSERDPRGVCQQRDRVWVRLSSSHGKHVFVTVGSVLALFGWWRFFGADQT